MTPMTLHLTPTVPARDEANSGIAERSLTRDPALLLYEHAAGLLASAGALHSAAHVPGADAALGPTLACLEASFQALVGGMEQLRAQAAPAPSEAVGGVATRTFGWDVERRLRDLIDALEATGITCSYARDAVRPVKSCA